MKYNEFLDLKTTGGPVYICFWKSPKYDDRTEVVGLHHFCADNGYTREDIAKIWDLKVSTTWVLEDLLVYRVN